MAGDDIREGIQEALRRLEAGLTKGKAAQSGRESAFVALKAVVDFVDSIDKFRENDLSAPLWALMLALHDLHAGTVSQMLKPTVYNNRHPRPTAQKQIQGVAAYSVDVLIHSGMTVRDASDWVATQLTKSGWKFKNRRTAQPGRTVENWRDGMSKLGPDDPSRHLWSSLCDESPPNTYSGEVKQVKSQLADSIRYMVENLGKYALE